MSTIYIITTIMIMFGLLLIFAFISQLLQKKKQQKNRLVSALKTRSRKIIGLLQAFPKNFLSDEFQVLLLTHQFSHTCAQEISHPANRAKILCLRCKCGSGRGWWWSACKTRMVCKDRGRRGCCTSAGGRERAVRTTPCSGGGCAPSPGPPPPPSASASAVWRAP